MTGEPQSDDDPDFLEDFILEEETAAKADLDSLFEAPAASPPETLAAMPPAGPAANADDAADDVLFTDHTPGLQPSEKFEGGKGFSETASSTWHGDALELDESGVPVDDEQGTGIERGAAATDGTEATFAAELDSLLQNEDEFALEADQELQIDEAGDSLLDDGVVGDTFVIDDGAGTWQEGAAAEQLAAEQQQSGAPVEGDAASAEDMPLEVVAENGEVEPGWEPLPGTSMDQLSEVADVVRVGGEDGVVETGDDQELENAASEGGVPAGVIPRPPFGMAKEVDAGQEIYAEAVGDGPVAVVGGRRRSGRVLRLVASLAASVAVVAAGVLLMWHPEWFGLRTAPEQVLSVQVKRPVVEVAVAAPPMPLPEAGTEPVPVETTPPASGQPSVVQVELPEPIAPIDPPTGPVAVVEPPRVVQAPGMPTVVPVPSPREGPTGPVASTGPAGQTPAAPDPRSSLVRVGEDLLVGEQVDATRTVVDGMLPGSRAFAQLHNGNYFIGSVKFVDPDRITLRLPTGEITLERTAIAKLTELGSSDYEELQRVTSGFVRLTNNNRLVGSILSGITDDHIIIESRSNRVMLPRTAVEEVVQAAGSSGGVRLGTTRAEDDWLHQLSERQIGGAGSDPKGQKVATPPSPRSK